MRPAAVANARGMCGRTSSAAETLSGYKPDFRRKMGLDGAFNESLTALRAAGDED